MNIFSNLYQKALQWSRHQYATYWLAIVSFTESCVFFIPPDIMLAPMALANRSKAWFYAAVTTIASVFGGLFGYLLGYFLFQWIEPVIISLGYQEAYQSIDALFEQWGFWAIFIAGFTPIPFKLFTIAAGAASMALVPFVIGALLSRGLRYFIEAGLMYWGGPPFEKHLHKYIDIIGWVTLVVLALAYLIFRH